MKKYHITTNYSQNQQMAVQQDHALTRLMLHILENPTSKDAQLFIEYAKKHETTICLNTSQPYDLIKFYSYIKFHQKELDIPVDFFQEMSLNNSMTALTFITNKKLSYNIYPEISKILQLYKINSLYDIKESMTLQNKSGTFLININFVNGKPLFTISFRNLLFKSTQNNEPIVEDINDMNIEELYKKYNEEDYCYHNDLDFENEVDQEEIIEEYSIVELEFMKRLRNFHLK